jgi:hypothetical protein
MDCGQNEINAAQVAVKEYEGYSTAPVASDGLMREAKIAAPTFDAAD